MARQDQVPVQRPGRHRDLHRLGSPRHHRVPREDRLISAAPVLVPTARGGRHSPFPLTVRNSELSEPGTEYAFRRFFDDHHTDLSRLAYLVTGDSQVADDLAADAFVEVWRHWERVQAADSPVAYARGIVTNLARQWIKKQTRERAGV